jgi:hypothetical protein
MNENIKRQYGYKNSEVSTISNEVEVVRKQNKAFEEPFVEHHCIGYYHDIIRTKDNQSPGA